MHLLFYGKHQIKVLGTQTVEHLLHEQSVKVSPSPAFQQLQNDDIIIGRENLRQSRISRIDCLVRGDLCSPNR